jgi:glucosylceramidase
MNKIITLFIFLCLLLFHCDDNATPVDNASTFTVKAWLTTGDKQKKLELQPDLTSKAGISDSGVQIDISSDQLYQEIDGFGAALTNSSAWHCYGGSYES